MGVENGVRIDSITSEKYSGPFYKGPIISEIPNPFKEKDTPHKIEQEIGKMQILPDGTKVITEIPNPIIDLTVIPDEVDEHESGHLAVALGLGVPIEEASVQPDGDSLGHVKTGHFSAPVAMAAHADGATGTAWDRMLVRLHGMSESSAASVAKNVLRQMSKVRKALSILLHKRGRVSGSEVEAEKERVEAGETAVTTVITPEGKQAQLITTGIHEGNNVEVNIGKLMPKTTTVH